MVVTTYLFYDVLSQWLRTLLWTHDVTMHTNVARLLILLHLSITIAAFLVTTL